MKRTIGRYTTIEAHIMRTVLAVLAVAGSVFGQDLWFPESGPDQGRSGAGGT